MDCNQDGEPSGFIRRMKNIFFSVFAILVLGNVLLAQPCGQAQSLSAMQQSQIANLLSPLDTALRYENLLEIDSLSNALKNVYAAQGGIPDAIEPYYALVSNNLWLGLSSAIQLSRELVAADSMVYVDLWKAAKGMAPPNFQPHSLFLRASAEIAVGLLKIADNETDLARKALYQSWATRALDSLATMQIQSGPSTGAFPFPDLRTYGDPVFSPIIQNFLNSCGPDSVNVLQNGWIIDDKGTGEFKFDAGVIANAYFEAFQYTGNTDYQDIALAIGDYLLPLKFNLNYNYNTFVSLGLTRAFQLSNDSNYLNRAIVNLRYAVSPGQIANGRWVDGHNANSRYHSIMIQNIVPTMAEIPSGNSNKAELELAILKAVQNMVDYTNSCNSATGYRWLMKASLLSPTILPNSLRDSVNHLIGRHINQSAINGKYLDIPTMGEYLELLSTMTDIEASNYPVRLSSNVFPNPSKGLTNVIFSLSEPDQIELELLDLQGRSLLLIDKGEKQVGSYDYQIDMSVFPAGTYVLRLVTKNRTYSQKLLRID